jgi:hypothetical protein
MQINKIDELFVIKNDKDEIIGDLGNIKLIMYKEGSVMTGDELRERVSILYRQEEINEKYDWNKTHNIGGNDQDVSQDYEPKEIKNLGELIEEVGANFNQLINHNDNFESYQKKWQAITYEVGKNGKNWAWGKSPEEAIRNLLLN